MAVLIALISSVIGGSSISSALAALTVDQWLTLTEAAAVDLAPEFAKLIGVKTSGNSLGSLIDGVVKAASDELIKRGVKDWLSANYDASLREQPGMGEH